MEPAAEESGRHRSLGTTPEQVMLNDREDWLAEEEARSDQRLLAKLSPEQRAELNLMMRGEPIGGYPVDLGLLERTLDTALVTLLASAERADLELIMRGESTNGVALDLDRLEECIDRQLDR